MRKPFGDLTARNQEGQAVLGWQVRSTREFPGLAADEFANWRIYRQQHADFDYGLDGPEYFLGLDGSEAELIYTGPLEAVGSHYTYCDTTAPLGATCSYYVSSATSGRVGPVFLRLHDPEIVWSHRTLMARLRALAAQAGDLARLTICGQSLAGRDIPCLELGRGDYCLGLVGLQHAGEAGPELIVPALERLWQEQPQLFARSRIVAVPALNVDRREELVEGVPWYVRTNLQGVDLNRNLPTAWEKVSYSYGADSSDPHSGTYRGVAPASAPETRALMSVLQAARPDVVLNYHWVYSLCSIPALTTPLAKDDAEHIARCWRLMRCWGAALFPAGEGLMADPTDLIPGLPNPGDWLRVDGTGGDLSAWLYAEQHVPSLTFEGHLAVGTDRSQHGWVDRPLLEEYRERHARALASLLAQRL